MGVSRTRSSWGSSCVVALFASSWFRADECPFVPGAGTLAFAIRSGVNLILLLARIQRARNVPRSVLV
jgi:hypothetical protein